MAFLPYNQCPMLYSGRPDVFRALFASATNRMVRMGMVGDSTWAADANGTGYMERLPLALNRLFSKGNTPGTPLSPQSDQGTTFTPCSWLQSSYYDGGGTISIASTYAPYGIRPFLVGTTVGLAVQLLPTAASVSRLPTARQASPFDPALIGTGPFNGGEWMQLPADPTTCPVEVEMLAHTMSTSGEIAYGSRANATGQLDDPGSNTVTGTSALTLQSGTLAVKSLKYNIPLASGQRMVTTNMKSSTLTLGAIGVRYNNLYNPAGFVIQPLAKGGMSYSTFVTDCANCGTILAGLGLDCLAFGFGINDQAVLHKTALQFHDDAAASLALARAALGSTFPIPLCAPRFYFGADSVYDQYAGALYDLCRNDPYTLFWNRRLALEAVGFKNDVSADPLYSGGVAVGVHDSLLGAQVSGDRDALTLASVLGVSRALASANNSQSLLLTLS